MANSIIKLFRMITIDIIRGTETGHHTNDNESWTSLISQQIANEGGPAGRIVKNHTAGILTNKYGNCLTDGTGVVAIVRAR